MPKRGQLFVQVRRAFLSMVAAWLGDESAGDSPPGSPTDSRPPTHHGQAMAAYQDALFPYVMAALADESPAITSEAVNILERLGTKLNLVSTQYTAL